MSYEIISPTLTLSKYEKKLAVLIHPHWTFYRHVFAHIYYVIHEFAHKDIYLQRTLIPLLIVIKRLTWYQNAWKNVPNMIT